MAMDTAPPRPPTQATATLAPAFVASEEGMYETGPVNSRQGFASHDRTERSAALQAVQVRRSLALSAVGGPRRTMGTGIARP